MKPVECVQCHKPIDQPEGRGRPRKYCSPNCGMLYRANQPIQLELPFGEQI